MKIKEKGVVLRCEAEVRTSEPACLLRSRCAARQLGWAWVVVKITLRIEVKVETKTVDAHHVILSLTGYGDDGGAGLSSWQRGAPEVLALDEGHDRVEGDTARMKGLSAWWFLS